MDKRKTVFRMKERVLIEAFEFGCFSFPSSYLMSC